MAYTVTNFKTKKALKEAVASWLAYDRDNSSRSVAASKGIHSIRCYNPGLGPDLSNFTGKVYLEGPHYSKPHSWYAQAELVNGIVVKVS